MTITPKFNIGDKVFHISKESEEGTVINWIYEASTKCITYTVALDFRTEVQCMGYELSDEITY